mmetsp:Transcript_6980/g.15952  ORF Transcript_6980/g.15952 Transcript_6980/m.15952 type:complete len:446 (+) Transcript_6980:231-1568(+)
MTSKPSVGVLQHALHLLELLLQGLLARLELLLLALGVPRVPPHLDPVVRNSTVHRGVAEEARYLLGERGGGRLAGLLDERHVGDDEGAHGLDDGDGAHNHAGVVPPLCLKGAVVAGKVGGGLRLADGCGGLEGDAEHNIHPVGDAALHAAAVVGDGDHLPVLDVKHIVVRRPAHSRPRKPRPNLEPLGGRDRHHGVRELGLELVEARLPQADGAVADHDGARAPHRVLVGAGSLDAVCHLVRRGDVRAAHHVLVHLVARDGVQVHLALGQHDVAHRAHPRHELRVVPLLQPLLRDRPSSHAPDGLAGAGTPASTSGAKAILHLIREVGVRGAGDLAHLAVVVGAHVLVADKEADGGAECEALLRARQDRHSIRLIPPRADGARAGLAGPAAVKLDLNVLLGDLHPGGHTLDNAPNAGAMALAKGHNLEQTAEGGHPAPFLTNLDH